MIISSTLLWGKPEQWCRSSYKVKGKIENIYRRILKNYRRRDIEKVYPCDHSKQRTPEYLTQTKFIEICKEIRERQQIEQVDSRQGFALSVPPCTTAWTRIFIVQTLNHIICCLLFLSTLLLIAHQISWLIFLVGAFLTSPKDTLLFLLCFVKIVFERTKDVLLL